MELSISVKFALAIMMVLITNKEYKRFINIDKMKWSVLFTTAALCAFSSFIAGALVHTALIDLLTEFHT